MGPRPRTSKSRVEPEVTRTSPGPPEQAEQANEAAPDTWPQVRELNDETVVLREGDEDAVYIYLDLSDVPTSIPLEGLEVQGFDTDTPKLRMPDGRELEGTYADALGSQLFFESAGAAGGEGRELKFVGLSEKVVRFRAPKEAAATQDS